MTRITQFALVFTAIFLLFGCHGKGLDSCRKKSSDFACIKDKIEFLNRYVKFRRTYEILDFDICYQNNSKGMRVPGPSYWDIRIVATVPKSEIVQWVSKGMNPISGSRDWLESIPTKLNLDEINEWYGDSHRIVGLDRKNRIVVYRNWTK